MSDHASESVRTALLQRFGEKFEVAPQFAGLPELAAIAGHRVQRRYVARPIAPDLLRLLCACALSAPSKSDLQQSDILIVRDATKRQMIADLLPDMSVSRHARPGHKAFTPVFDRLCPVMTKERAGLRPHPALLASRKCREHFGFHCGAAARTAARSVTMSRNATARPRSL
jgi:hypothetical protein